METDRSHSALGLSLNSFNHWSWSEKEPLSLSAKFSTQSELSDFFGFSCLVFADENGHDLFFFFRRHLNQSCSLRSWRDFARECFCFGCEAVNGSGEAVGGLVKSRVDSQLRRSPALASRQLHRLSILRHVLRDKMTPLYLVICFVTSYSRMTGLVNG